LAPLFVMSQNRTQHMVVSTLGDTLYCGRDIGTIVAHMAVPRCVSTEKVDTNIIAMVWNCSDCGTLNANISDSCVVCDMVATHKGHTDDLELYDIYLETIYWYMRAEVENRLHNTQVMSLNGFTI
jgi:hypothetical protein